jgi:hypothetical protein
MRNQAKRGLLRVVHEMKSEGENFELGLEDSKRPHGESWPEPADLWRRFQLVPETGLEPVLPCGKRILSRIERGGGSTFT